MRKSFVVSEARKIRVMCAAVLIFSFCAATCPAAEITSVQARTAVGNWLRRDASPLEAKLGGTALDAVTYKNAGGDSLFYVVPLEGGGFVVTSADDGIQPVIAFSEGSNLVADEGNPLWALLNKDLSQRRDALAMRRASLGGKSVETASAQQPVQDSPEAAWAELLNDRPIMAMGLTSISDVRILPIVLSHWGQSTVSGFWGDYPCYNYYTPNNYVCGCVATAMAQIMRYHRYPTASVSAKTFSCKVNGTLTSLTMLGGIYNWDNMMLTPDEGGDEAPNATIRAAIGKLCYDAGVSVKMQYNASGGSSAYATDVPKALTNVFGYASAVVCSSNPASVSERDIRNAILVNLDHGYPVLLGIWGASEGGHAVVADGYGYNSSVRYIHLNMGWNGGGNGDYQNAWYNVPTVDTAEGTYSVLNDIVYNIFPDMKKGLVSGRVLSASGFPVVGATVLIKDVATGDVLLTLITDSKGMYTFYGDDSGTGENSARVCATDGNYISNETNITVKISNNSTIGNIWGVDLYLNKFAPDTVTFDSQGGTTPVPVSITVTNGSAYGTLATTTRTGYTFAGWWTGINGTGTQVLSATIFTGTTAQTLYAKWTANGYRLTVTSVYGGVQPGTDTNILYGTTLSASVTNSPVVSGTTQYVCKGWTGTGSVPTSGTTTNTGSFTMTNDSTLVWLWTTNYWLDTGVNSNGAVNVPDGWCPKGSNVQVTATAAEHYHFASWSGQTNGCAIASNVITAPMTAPRAITANFVVDQHSLIVTTPYGKASPSAGTNWFNWNGSVAAVLTNSPVVNGTTQYVCTGWTGAGSIPPGGTGTNTGLFTLTNNSSIVWLWTTNYWLDTATNGSGTVNQPDQWCGAGSNVVITATPSVSNRFTGWTGQTNGCTINSNQITASMTSPRQITANFVRQYGLLVSTLYGQGDIPAGTNFFDTGTSVTVRMTNSPVTIGTTQYVCRGWVGTGNVPASGTTTSAGPFTITGDSTITWLWKTNFWLDTGYTGSGNLNTGDCWLASGTNLQVTATPSNHWHFGSWSGDTNGCTIASNKITALMSGARFIAAGFSIDQHKLIVTTSYGQANPSAGTNWFDYGSSNSVALTNSPVIFGGTQYVCRGWTRTGNVPGSGTTTNTGLFVLTNDCSVVWLWTTNYWLHADTSGNGSVNTSDVWLASGTNIQVTAIPGTYYAFGGWQGQTNGCTITSNKITAVMTMARDIGALFIAEMATNAVPRWWLAQHNLTNFNVDAMTDADLDGQMTWQEYIVGSDPTNRESFFRIIKCDRNEIGWDAVSGRVYSVYWATNLLTGFQCLGSNIPWTQGGFTNPVVVPCGYYKIDVRMEE
jgi:uncharacterized repeat protein (TIGR02543 family)